MKFLALNEEILYSIKTCEDTWQTYEKVVLPMILDLDKLYDIETLSDAEIKKIVAKYYRICEIEDGFTKAFIKALFKSKSKSRRIKTNIISQGLKDETFYNDAHVVYCNSVEMSPKRIYTYQELINLINERKLLVERLSYSKDRTPSLAHKADDLVSKLPSLASITEKEFFGYDDIIIPIIKRYFKKEKVYKDICEIINLMRARLLEEKYQLVGMRDFATKRLHMQEETYRWLEKDIERNLKKFDK